MGVFRNDQQRFMERCLVTSDQIRWLAEQTKEQQKSLLWGQNRQLRLTGSNFGVIVAAYDRHQLTARPYPPSLFKSLMGKYNLAGKHSILWVQMHEERAIEEYIRQTGNPVKRVGLILPPWGFLGCSPDGIITVAGAANKEHGVLEVKCPWGHRNRNFDEMMEDELLLSSQERQGGCCYFLRNEERRIRETHNYRHQVQEEMVAANVSRAHFVIWTTKELKVIYGVFHVKSTQV